MKQCGNVCHLELILVVHRTTVKLSCETEKIHNRVMSRPQSVDTVFPSQAKGMLHALEQDDTPSAHRCVSSQLHWRANGIENIRVQLFDPAGSFGRVSLTLQGMPGGLGKFVYKSVGAHRCRLQHQSWEQYGDGLAS